MAPLHSFQRSPPLVTCRPRYCLMASLTLAQCLKGDENFSDRACCFVFPFSPHFILAMYLCLPSTTTYITYQIRCRCLFCKPHVAFINNASTFSLSPISQHTYIQPLSASNCSFSDISLHALMNLNKKMLRFCLFFSWVKFINH